MAAATSGVEPVIIGRYAIFEEVARGGMAAVHAGRLCGPGGFSKTVAVKRLHPGYASNPEFVAMFLDEARLAARIQHPNVVSVMDVVATKGELFMVMEYVHGESLSNLLRASRARQQPVSPEIAVHIATNLLFGLHAAHEAKTADSGEPLGIVHRDVSPQNVLVGTDGIARVVDFGVAKAAQRMHETRDGSVKGKVAYMSPEQLSGKELDRRTDIWAASVILWEALCGRRMFDFEELGHTIAAVLGGNFDPPSKHAGPLPAGLDEIVLKGLAVNVSERWSTAEEMALALEAVSPPVPARTVARWVESVADEKLRLKADIISRTAQRPLPALVDLAAAASTSLLSGGAPPSPLPPRVGRQPQIAREDATLAEQPAAAGPSADAAVTRRPSRRAAAVLGVSMALAVVGLVLIVRTLVARTGAAAASAAAPGVTTPLSTTALATSAEGAPNVEPPPVRHADEPSGPTEPAPDMPSPPPTTQKASKPRATSAPPPSRTTDAPPTAAQPTAPPTPVAPAAPPAPPPATAAAPPPEPPRPRFVVASARVEVGGAKNAMGTTASNVNRVVGPLSGHITECYRSALPRMNDPLEGAGNIHLETDEDGVIARAQVSGAATAAGPCIASVVSGRKIPNVDTGRARADVPLVFRAQ